MQHREYIRLFRRRDEPLADFGALLGSVLKLTHAPIHPGTEQYQEINKRIEASQKLRTPLDVGWRKEIQPISVVR